MKIKLLIAFLLIYSGLSFGQNKNRYREKEQQLIKKVEESNGDIEQKISHLVSLIDFLSKDKNEIKRCISYYKELEKLAVEHKSFDNLGKAYRIIGDVYSHVDVDKGLEYYHKALNLFKKTNNLEQTGITYRFMAGLYGPRRDYKECIAAHEKSIKILEQLDYDKLHENYFNYAQALFNTGKYEKSALYLEKALKLCEHLDSDWKYYIRSMMHQNDYDNKNYNKALKNYQNLMIEMEEDDTFLFSTHGLGYYYDCKSFEILCYTKLKNTNKALELLNVLENKDFSDIHLNNRMYIIYNIYRAYEQLNLYKKANSALKEHYKLLAQFRKENKEKNFKLRTVLFEIEEKDLHIEEQQKEINFSYLILFSLSIFFIFCFILLIISRVYLKKSKKQSKIIFDQKEKIESALKEQIILRKELNHRVKNNLQIISSILSLSELNNTNDINITNSIKNIESRIESIAILHKELSLNNNVNNVNLNLYLKDVIEIILKTFGVLTSQLTVEVPNINLSSNKAVTLALLINELITNSIKHNSQNDIKISIKLKELENNTYELLYNDYNTEYFEDKKKGLGHIFISHFAKNLNGKHNYIFINKNYVFSLKFSTK